jgi:Kef-type K+ transport system membrane component KefB
MWLLYNTMDFSLPLTNPVLLFALILAIILFAPLILNKFKIPHLIGLIIAGALIGPNGFNLMLRDSSIELFGKVGILYIMFLAGLEINLAEFKKNSLKSAVFGMYTFLIPMILGIVVGIYYLGFSTNTSILLASMFASHTLIAYPIVSKLGITNNRAVNITVGGTMITDTLALLVLAVIVGMSTGEIDNRFWITLSISVVVFALVVVFLFPLVGRWFFKNFDDNISQYIFVLSMVFLGAFLAQMAGIEDIIGAFLVGLSLNRLIPHTSPLMNRINFVGNALFIPFFLIGVGMLIDFRAFFMGMETVIVAVTMTVVATFAKYAAAWLTQKTFKFSRHERSVIFGLSNAQAAATLAAVLVGYNIILGETPTGEPIRLLSDSILNGTILMILITCTIASFATQSGAHHISLLEASAENEGESSFDERILVPLKNPETIEELVNMGVTIRSKGNKSGLYALKILNNSVDDWAAEKQAKEVLSKAEVTASATDTKLNQLLRYDNNVVSGITNVVKEHKITDIILGLHNKKGLTGSFLGNLSEGVLMRCIATTYIYRPTQPLATIKRHLVIVPPNAERVIGFSLWVNKVLNISRNTGSKLVFYGTDQTLEIIRKHLNKNAYNAEYKEFSEWEDFLILSREVHENDNLVIVLSRKEHISYNNEMARIPVFLNKYFQNNSYLLIYPIQRGMESEVEGIDLNNPSMTDPLRTNIEIIDDLGKSISKIFKKR